MSQPIDKHFKFLDTAFLFAMDSHDQSTWMGAVIVGKNNAILSTGLNGFPRGINDHVQARQERPEKYHWMEHAERNAVYNAAEAGIALRDTRIYITCHPCAECMRAIIQCGIKEVFVPPEEFWVKSEAMIESMSRAAIMAIEARIQIQKLHGYKPLQAIKIKIGGKFLTSDIEECINIEHINDICCGGSNG